MALFHTLHLFGRGKAARSLALLPEVAEADLPTNAAHKPLVFPDIRRVPRAMQPPIFEDRVLGRGMDAPLGLGPPETFTKPAIGDRRAWSAMDTIIDTVRDTVAAAAESRCATRWPLQLSASR